MSDIYSQESVSLFKWFSSIQNVFANTCKAFNQYCEQQHMKVITGCLIVTHLIEIYCNVGNIQLFLLMLRSGVFAGRQVSRMVLFLHLYLFIFSTIFLFHLIRLNIKLCTLLVHSDASIQVRLIARFC